MKWALRRKHVLHDHSVETQSSLDSNSFCWPVEAVFSCEISGLLLTLKFCGTVVACIWNFLLWMKNSNLGGLTLLPTKIAPVEPSRSFCFSQHILVKLLQFMRWPVYYNPTTWHFCMYEMQDSVGYKVTTACCCLVQVVYDHFEASRHFVFCIWTRLCAFLCL